MRIEGGSPLGVAIIFLGLIAIPGVVEAWVGHKVTFLTLPQGYSLILVYISLVLVYI
jgi:hypothetical protein